MKLGLLVGVAVLAWVFWMGSSAYTAEKALAECEFSREVHMSISHPGWERGPQ